MTLKELFESVPIHSAVELKLVEKNWDDEPYEIDFEFFADGSLPIRFEPYEDAEVADIRSTEIIKSGDLNHIDKVNALSVTIIHKVDEDMAEIEYTGGNIWCGYIKVKDGWFGGAENEFGCVWKTYTDAVSSYCDEDSGLVRYVEDLDEQIGIWTRIYRSLIDRNDAYSERWEENLLNLVDDLKSMES